MLALYNASPEFIMFLAEWHVTSASIFHTAFLASLVDKALCTLPFAYLQVPSMTVEPAWKQSI